MDVAKLLQIVKVEDGGLKLNEELLSEALNQEDIKDRKAVIIAISGSSYEGNSFLLGSFLCYLYSQVCRSLTFPNLNE